MGVYTYIFTKIIFLYINEKWTHRQNILDSELLQKDKENTFSKDMDIPSQ